MYCSVCNLHWEKYEGVIFHLQFLEFSRNAKNDQNWYLKSFLVIFRYLKVVWQTWKNVLLHVYFLRKKNWIGNISSSVPKAYNKMQKMRIFIHFFPIFMVLKLGYGKYKKIVRFWAVALSFIYFPQKNNLDNHISVLKI